MLAARVRAALVRQLVMLTTDPVDRHTSRDRFCTEHLALASDDVGRGQVYRLTPTAVHKALDDVGHQAVVLQLCLDWEQGFRKLLVKLLRQKLCSPSSVKMTTFCFEP